VLRHTFEWSPMEPLGPTLRPPFRVRRRWPIFKVREDSHEFKESSRDTMLDAQIVPLL